jgi:hypothetical protein
VKAIQAGKVNLDDPATTLTLLQLGAVVGVTGVFNDPNDTSKGLKAVGVQCALCHSTVDDSFAPGIGHWLDGWANQDLNVGAIIALAPTCNRWPTSCIRDYRPANRSTCPRCKQCSIVGGPATSI